MIEIAAWIQKPSFLISIQVLEICAESNLPRYGSKGRVTTHDHHPAKDKTMAHSMLRQHPARIVRPSPRKTESAVERLS